MRTKILFSLHSITDFHRVFKKRIKPSLWVFHLAPDTVIKLEPVLKQKEAKESSFTSSYSFAMANTLCLHSVVFRQKQSVSYDL